MAVGLFAGLGATMPMANGQGKLPTIGVDEIKAGMKGYGLTVFQGTTPERFDVEVIGVQHNFRPSQDLILIKTPHPKLNSAKVVRGMSGSPIFFDGRLAGAYAYGYNFMVDPIAGVTPIAPMIAEMKRPIPPGFWPLEKIAPLPAGAAKKSTGKPTASTTSFDGQPGGYDLESHAKQLASKIGSGGGDSTKPMARAETPIMMGGVGDRTAKAMAKMFEPLGLDVMQAGGGNGEPTATTPLHYENGGPLGVALARGDVSFTGMGTTTYVEGNMVAGFGHPMMEGGNSALPSCIGNIVWLMQSTASSWKIGECARPLGALIQDRQSAIILDETKSAPMFPVDVSIAGPDLTTKKKWHIDVAEERFMAPSLAAAVISSAIEAAVNEKRDVTWHLKSKLSIVNHGTLELEDFGIAVGGMPEVPELFHTRLVRALGDVINNPWENTRIEKIEATFSVDYTRDLWRLRGVELLDPVVDAGEKAKIRLTLVPHLGQAITRVVEVKLPAELAGKDVDVDIVPGWDVQKEVGSPETFADLLANETRASYLPKSIVLQFRVPGMGVTFSGHVAGRLPSYALDALRPATSDAIPETYPAYSRTVVALDKYVEGRDKVKIRVRPVVR
jgi:hypothetical protein